MNDLTWSIIFLRVPLDNSAKTKIVMFFLTKNRFQDELSEDRLYGIDWLFCAAKKCTLAQGNHLMMVFSFSLSFLQFGLCCSSFHAVNWCFFRGLIARLVGMIFASFEHGQFVVMFFFPWVDVVGGGGAGIGKIINFSFSF